jgi:hypothetical protein
MENVEIDKTKPIWITTSYEDGSKVTCVYNPFLNGDIDVLLEKYKKGDYGKNVKISN